MPRSRHLGLTVLAVPLIAALSGCALVATFSPHIEPEIYETVADLKTANATSIGSPSFIPDDATIIRVDYDTRSGEAIMTYTSDTQLTPDVCTEETTPPKPTIEDSWWPIAGVPEKASLCPGDWAVFAVGSQMYAARPASK